MPTLPDNIIAVLAAFAPLFSAPAFAHAQVLLAGAILTPGKRTVTAALRVMGLATEVHFQNYHRVLSRDRWSGRLAARTLLRLLAETLAPAGPLVLGLDETLERRQGAKIAAKGIYRDAARSSHSFFVKSSGLRWISLMLLAPVPWAGRVWALPFLTALAPSERYHRERGQRHKKLTDWARQMLLQVRRWVPGRSLVVVADAGYAVLGLLDRCRRLREPITVVTRLRLDAALYEPAPERRAGQNGRPRKKGKRLPTLAQERDSAQTPWATLTVARWYGQGERQIEVASRTAVWYHSGLPPVPVRWVLLRDPQGRFETQGLLCTDVTAEPAQVIAWFMQRWQMESTFQQVRTHLGVETQRQWSDAAIERTTPVLLGLFSLVTLTAHSQMDKQPVRQAAWYKKPLPTFIDALALVRRCLWHQRFEGFCLSIGKGDTQELPPLWLDHLAETLCYAA